jgi:2-(1,2-epoxy-1,2-dihydrophenyl)acetyl-CoA isomerase
MNFETLGLQTDGDIGVLTLCRPEVLNAIDIPMARELERLSIELRQRPRIRALVITGAGRAFCAGGDLGSFRRPRGEMQAHSLEITRYLHAAIVNFSRMDLPTVAAVNGVAAGAGFALVCACDLAVAANSATFIAAYTLAGLSPDLGLTHFLPRLVGLSAAKSIILTNRRIQAAEAERLGIVSQVASDAETVVVDAKEMCSLVLKGSSAAIGATKRLLGDSHAAGLEDQLQAESESLAALSASEDTYQRCRRFVK